MNSDEQKQAHQEILRLWKHYQDLMKALVTFQAELEDLNRATNSAGQKIYKLYKKSADGLDGDGSEAASQI